MNAENDVHQAQQLGAAVTDNIVSHYHPTETEVHRTATAGASTNTNISNNDPVVEHEILKKLHDDLSLLLPALPIAFVERQIPTAKRRLRTPAAERLVRYDKENVWMNINGMHCCMMGVKSTGKNQFGTNIDPRASTTLVQSGSSWIRTLLPL
mmetsp:Transcript_8536/g.19107  ORF Transcript_8536/g.19107 Transcript_8536/m.19107 type:complete len:153 (+) Transcript_8536:4082-4540(+)